MGSTPGQPEPMELREKKQQTVAERLERGEVVYFPTCPFSLPEGEERRFLLEQRLGSRAHKNISHDPSKGKSGGYQFHDRAQADRLGGMLADFSRIATAWLAEVLSSYANSWQLDRVSYRPEEEATRRLRQTARNDLLHVDAFPSRPSNGFRILRLFANVNLTEPRVWITSDPFAKLFERYGTTVGLPRESGVGWTRWIKQEVAVLFRPGWQRRSAYDDFMLRFHDFLKANDDFQERCFKRYWSFPPGSAWMAMTDTASHAVLRGRYALEHSYFIAPETLALPDEAPAAILERACRVPVLNRAA